MSENEYSFRDAAERAAKEVTPPKPLPSGMWRFGIRGGSFKEISGRGDKAPVAEASYALTVMEPLEGVNDVELEAFGDYSEANNVFYSIPIWRRDDEWKVVKFHSEILVQEIDGLSIGELPGSGDGYEFVAEVSHRFYGEDNTDIALDVKNATRIEF